MLQDQFSCQLEFNGCKESGSGQSPVHAAKDSGDPGNKANMTLD